MMLLISIIARGGTSKAKLTTKLAGIVPDVAAKFHFGDLIIEFVPDDAAEETERVLLFAMLIADVPQRNSEESAAGQKVSELADDS
jgi:hypothetical protein